MIMFFRANKHDSSGNNQQKQTTKTSQTAQASEYQVSILTMNIVLKYCCFACYFELPVNYISIN